MASAIRSLIGNFKKKLKDKAGAAVIEYGMLVAGVGLTAAAALSVLGHKTTDLLATSAAVLPGAHADGNAPILSGSFLETGANADGAITLDIGEIGERMGSSTARLEANLGFAEGSLEDLVADNHGHDDDDTGGTT